MLILVIPIFFILLLIDFLPELGVFFKIEKRLIENTSVFLGTIVLPITIISVTLVNIAIDKKENKNSKIKNKYIFTKYIFLPSIIFVLIYGVITNYL